MSKSFLEYYNHYMRNRMIYEIHYQDYIGTLNQQEIAEYAKLSTLLYS